MQHEQRSVVPAVGEGYAVLTPSFDCSAFEEMPVVALEVHDDDDDGMRQVVGIAADGSVSYVAGAALRLPDGRVLDASGETYSSTETWLAARLALALATRSAKKARIAAQDLAQ